MRSIFLLVLVLGIGIAGFAVYKAQEHFDAGDQQAEALVATINELRAQVVETGEVFIFAQAHRYGERITPDDVTPVRFPVDAIPEASFTSMEDLFPEGTVQFRALLRSVEAGEIVMPVKVTEPGENVGIMNYLQPGNSAFAINVNATSGVSGFLRPGDNVNVFWTGTVQGQEITKLIDTDVNLIAVDQSSDEDFLGARVASTVTVQGTAGEIARLQQAQSSGRLTLSLVRSGDTTTEEDVSTNLLDVLDIEIVEPEPEPEVEPEPEPEPEPEVCYQTIRRGTEVDRIPVPCN